MITLKLKNVDDYFEVNLFLLHSSHIPQHQLELYNDRYIESHLDTKDFNKDASNLFYKFYFVLFFKYLDKIYGVKK